jgi:hypothetical protein
MLFAAYLLTSVDLDVGSLGSTENVQTIFELLPWSVVHVRWNSSNIVWTFSVLPREPISWSTEVSKELPEFHYDLPLARHNFSKPRRDFVDTLYSDRA